MYIYHVYQSNLKIQVRPCPEISWGGRRREREREGGHCVCVCLETKSNCSFLLIWISFLQCIYFKAITMLLFMLFKQNNHTCIRICMKTIQMLRKRPETDYTHVKCSILLRHCIQDCHKTLLSLIRYLYQFYCVPFIYLCSFH